MRAAERLQAYAAGQGERDVLRDAERFEQREMLEHHRHARLAVPLDRARVGLHHAVDDLHQRGLARAVLAEHRVDLARGDVETDAVEREHGGVALDDAGKPEERLDGVFSGDERCYTRLERRL